MPAPSPADFNGPDFPAVRPADTARPVDRTLLPDVMPAASGPDRTEALTRFAGGVAHDFNNLLMVISGHVELLLDKLPADHAVRAEAAAIQTAVDLAARLTGQLLAISERQVLVPAVTDLNDMVADAVTALSEAAQMRVSVRTSFSPGPLPVRVDRARFGRALADLIANALEATPTGSTMTVATHAVDEMALFTVTDGGIGLDGAQRARAFEPFALTGASPHRSGLALAAARGVVLQTGGRLLVSSQPGRGSVFTVVLPVVAESVIATERVTRSGDTGNRDSDPVLSRRYD